MSPVKKWVSVTVNGKSLQQPLVLQICNTFISRLRGFLFSPPPNVSSGLLFCYPRDSRLDSAIHMMGVGFALGVIWLNRDKKVVDITLALPWRLAYLPKNAASYIIECHPDRINEFEKGDEVYFEEWSGKELV